MIDRVRLEQLLSRFSQRTLGVVGDIFLDRYLDIEPIVRELSVETGLEAYQIATVRNLPGAAGTVMNNLAALGIGRIVPVTVIGDDGHGYDLRHALSRLPVDMSLMVSDPQRLTPTYTKPLKQDSSGNCRELNRLDVRCRNPISETTCHTVCRHVHEVFESTDGLIVLDQVNEENWGVINRPVRECLMELAKAHPDRLVLIDSRQWLGSFRHGVLKGNQSEIIAATGFTGDGESVALQAAQQLAQRTRNSVFCTMGSKGILVARPDGGHEIVAGIPAVGAVDIVGAGDSVSSGIASAWIAGADDLEAAVVGNLVASITVQQIGTTGTASPDQILARWQDAYGTTGNST